MASTDIFKGMKGTKYYSNGHSKLLLRLWLSNEWTMEVLTLSHISQHKPLASITIVRNQQFTLLQVGYQQLL